MNSITLVFQPMVIFKGFIRNKQVEPQTPTCGSDRYLGMRRLFHWIKVMFPYDQTTRDELLFSTSIHNQQHKR